MQESTLCGAHGNAPQIQNAVQRRQAQVAARSRAVQKYQREGPEHIHGVADVIDMLEDRLGVQVKMAKALDEIVGSLIAASELRYEHRAGEQLRGEVEAWIRLNQMVTKLGSDYLKIDLAGKKVQIAEAQARILIGVIQAVLSRLELNRDQKRLAAQVVPQELERASVESGK